MSATSEVKNYRQVRTPLRRKDTPAVRRQELIDAAIEVIGRKGLSHTTLADIAQQAGLGYGNLTFRFKTKDALLLAALHSVTDEYMATRDEAAGTPDVSPAERLDLMLASSFHRKVTSQKKIALWHAFLSECHTRASFRKLFADMREREYELTRSLCEAVIKSGNYRDKDPHVVTIGINSLVEGLWFNMRLAPRAITREQAHLIARTFLASLFPAEFGPLLERPAQDRT